MDDGTEEDEVRERGWYMGRRLFWVCAAMMLLALPVHGQKIESYLNDMREALVPYGTMTAPTCHEVEIDMLGTLGNFAVPDGTDKNGELTWAILKVDVLRLYVNLSDLDEDKVQNQAIFSLQYLSDHKKGTRYVADTPMVMLSTHGLNTNVTVNAVDLDKVNALRGKTNVTEDQMGLFVDLRKGAMITFADQRHADVFQKAIQKAIVLCKAQ